jgi:hypothetical protein
LFTQYLTLAFSILKTLEKEKTMENQFNCPGASNCRKHESLTSKTPCGNESFTGECLRVEGMPTNRKGGGTIAQSKIIHEMGFEACEFGPNPNDNCDECSNFNLQLYYQDSIEGGRYVCLSCILKERCEELKKENTRYKEALELAYTELKHSYIFCKTREKMASTGLELYLEVMTKIREALTQTKGEGK